MDRLFVNNPIHHAISVGFTTGGKAEEYSNMYKVAATSNDFNEIVKAAK